MRSRFFYLLCLILAGSLCLTPIGAQAAPGMPGSTRFGLGMRLNPNSPDIEMTIQTAGNLGLDWLAVDFDWSALAPTLETPPQWSALDEVMRSAKDHQLTVLVSISKPPSWVLTPQGPDPNMTTRLTAELVKRYRSTLLAVELFPGANTQQGWGAPPNPQSYARLVENVYGDLQNIGPEITLVAAGLMPNSSPQDIQDLDFLQALYNTGAAPYMPVIGLRLPNISTDPSQPPSGPSATSLRHYEAVRDIMLQNSHQNGLIWVTGFSWDSQSVSSRESQATWLEDAFLMMRAQLYIGTAFIQDLNPFAPGSQNHPAIIAIRQITVQDSSQEIEEKTQLSKKSRKALSKKH